MLSCRRISGRFRSTASPETLPPASISSTARRSLTTPRSTIPRCSSQTATAATIPRRPIRCPTTMLPCSSCLLIWPTITWPTTTGLPPISSTTCTPHLMGLHEPDGRRGQNPPGRQLPEHRSSRDHGVPRLSGSRRDHHLVGRDRTGCGECQRGRLQSHHWRNRDFTPGSPQRERQAVCQLGPSLALV